MFGEEPSVESAVLTYEDIEDLLVTALEGGSNYWYYLPDLKMLPRTRDAEGHRGPISTDIAKAVWADPKLKIPVDDRVDGVHVGYITKAGLAGALNKMLVPESNYRRSAGNIIAEDYDGSDADNWFQFAVMGKAVYG